jgi:hypothetical protein
MNRSQDPKVERRGHHRARTTLEISLHHEQEVRTVKTENISMSGLSCNLPAPLTLYTKYGFRLFVPDGETGVREIDGEGIVVRVEEVEVDGEILFQTAFFFQHLDEGHRQILESYLTGDS